MVKSQNRPARLVQGEGLEDRLWALSSHWHRAGTAAVLPTTDARVTASMGSSVSTTRPVLNQDAREAAARHHQLSVEDRVGGAQVTMVLTPTATPKLTPTWPFPVVSGAVDTGRSDGERAGQRPAATSTDGPPISGGQGFMTSPA